MSRRFQAALALGLFVFGAACDKKKEEDEDADTITDISADLMPDTPVDALPETVMDVPEEGSTDPLPDPVDEEADGPLCAPTDALAVTVTTVDGVDLIADVYLTGEVGAPAVVLLHQNPLGFDKDSWPEAFITDLVDRGYNVFNLNRRGATGSGGNATDAFVGELGKWDARAAVDWLTAHPCDPGPIAMVGASNGTTTQVDYSIWAEAEAGYDQPVVQVFLSGGTWTENQYAMADNTDVLDNHPILFVYPTPEAAWNEGIEALSVPEWSFSEQSTTAHGSFMLSDVPALIGQVGDFLDLYL